MSTAWRAASRRCSVAGHGADGAGACLAGPGLPHRRVRRTPRPAPHDGRAGGARALSRLPRERPGDDHRRGRGLARFGGDARHPALHRPLPGAAGPPAGHRDGPCARPIRTARRHPHRWRSSHTRAPGRRDPFRDSGRSRPGERQPAGSRRVHPAHGRRRVRGGGRLSRRPAVSPGGSAASVTQSAVRTSSPVSMRRRCGIRPAGGMA